MKEERAASAPVVAPTSSLHPHRTRIEVVAAVLERADGAFLLAQRPHGKAYAGYWEFPGGKVEPGESAANALARELHEELGIDVERSYPWITRDYDYEHAAVRLRFFRVRDWTGELHGKEQQAFAWQRIDAIAVSPVLPANGPIFRALALPQFYGITNAGDAGEDAFLYALERALANGLKLVQVRENGMDEATLVAFTRRVVELAHGAGARVMANGDAALARNACADGVHLTASRLMQLTHRPDSEIVGASCHDERELARAVELELDFAVMGPVKDTESHPHAQTLGWQRMSEIIEGCPLPVYAVGGLTRADLKDAWAAGAHGVAAIRAAWA